MTVELMSFAEAAQAAIAESEQASSDVTEAALPVANVEEDSGEGQAEAEQSEQAESQESTEVTTEGDEVEEEESLFAGIEPADEEGTVPDDTTFELPGVEGSISLAELKDGFLRQADYTRKTQDLAENKKATEKELEFVAALRANPDAVIHSMAVKAGLIEEGDRPSKTVEWSPLQSQEEMQAEVDRLVEEKLESHPDVIESKRQQAIATIDQEFDRIGTEAGVVIAPKDREVVMREAQRRGVADLELVFGNLMSQREKANAGKQALKDAAPSRPTGTPSSEARTEPAGSFKEAAAMALAEMGIE